MLMIGSDHEKEPLGIFFVTREQSVRLESCLA